MDDYRIYYCADGRLRVYIKSEKRIISYPRFVMEHHLGRQLAPNEQIHHKDGNPLNNDLSNLEVRLLGEHQREHNPAKYFDKKAMCAWCGKEFVWTAKQQRQHFGNANRRGRKEAEMQVFCSKSCCGSYGKSQQLSK